MDALIEKKPKSRSGYTRMKVQREFLFKDIEALETLVGTLLGHLERATQTDLTDPDRIRYRVMVNEIRSALADDETQRVA